MKAISLWQPWGSLWLSGRKVHETRSWHIQRQWQGWTPGARMAVHAAKRFEKDHYGPFAQILRETFGATWYRDLPTGAIIGTIAVTDCQPTEKVYPNTRYEEPTSPEAVDCLCGDFYPGRFAWKGADPVIFANPIPWRGAQGVFNVPDDLLERDAA